MIATEIHEIQHEKELSAVLRMCYDILEEQSPDLESSPIYGYSAWLDRLRNGRQPLVYASEDEQIVSAVLGRAESSDSMIIGLVACDKVYRRRGITKQLMGYFEDTVKKMGYRYITLGSFADEFYEHCGYKVICKLEDQNIYQKLL